MGGTSEELKIEAIDIILKDAEVCNAQLNYLHFLYLKTPNVDESKSKRIKKKCQKIFEDMMSKLYSVLDRIYYFLYCCFRKEGNESFPIINLIEKDLKWSEDNDSECKERRNEWVTNQCKKLFGDFNFPESKRGPVRDFQNNLLQLQAIRKVDQRGHEVLGPNGEPTLLHLKEIKHDGAEGNLSQFNPSSVEVVELKCVANMNDWNVTTQFNLLHFFSSTGKIYLIGCKTAGQNLTEPGVWILVPELSHLRQVGRKTGPTYYQYKLTVVCSRLLSFVKHLQRDTALKVLDHKEDYPYVVNWTFDGVITVKKGAEVVEKFPINV